ncbi:YncE family protein [uncultured Aquimarina sp.]|uniref:YncE family protein n=1 Tax=uncultured Aquimarina sp. TaxID=575652 RepID=UPI00262C8DF0|nr:YncE family protein [uncultured Aquimarina sp.]
MIKTLNRPRMIPLVPLELKSQTNFIEGKNLTPMAMPSTASITTSLGQSSILDLSVAIQNTSTDTPIEVKAIAIQLPVNTGLETTNLTTIAALSAIISSIEGNLWDVNFGAVPGQFLATPKTGDSVLFSSGESVVFYLDNIKLNNTVGISSISIKVKDVSGTITDLTTTVTKEIAKAAITKFDSQDSNILPGATTSLLWNTNEIDYCLISPGYDNRNHPLGINGNLKIQPKESISYTLLAYGVGIILSDQTTITVNRAKIVQFNPINEATYGQKVDLYWETNVFTDSVKLSSTPKVTIPETLPTTGKVTVGPLTMSTTFTLEAFDATGIPSTPVSQKADLKPYIVEFSLAWKNNKLIATWETQNTTQVSLQPVPNILNSSGEIELYPAYPLQSRYTLIAKNDSDDAVMKTFENTYDSIHENPHSPIELKGVNSVAVSPDSKTIYLATDKGLIVLDSTTLVEFPNSAVAIENNPCQVIVSKKDNRIFIITKKKDIGLIVLDSNTLQEIEGSPVSLGDGVRSSIAISPDFKRIYITETNVKGLNQITILDYETFQKINSISIPIKVMPSLAVSHDSKHIFMTDTLAGNLLIYDAETLLQIPESPIKAGIRPQSMAVSPDGSRLYITDWEGNTITIINAKTFTEIPESPIKVARVQTGIPIALSVDGSFIFFGKFDENTVTILNAKTLKPTKGSPILTSHPENIIISNNGTVNICGFRNWTLSVFIPGFIEVIEE